MKDVFALRLWWAAWELKEGLGSKSILMRKLTAEKAEICNAHCTNTLCNSVKNTKYKVQYMKYDVQTHKALIQYSTMCKSTREKKVKLWPLLHSCRLSIIRSFQSICIHSVFLVLCIFVLSICIFIPSVFFLYSIICVWCLVFFTPVNCQLSVVVFNSYWRCQYFNFFILYCLFW